ncbi:MAG: hypothetical protein MSG78_01600 [Clostridiales bacterium]|nr:hypothetical protein [Clostridiales bacterium]
MKKFIIRILLLVFLFFIIRFSTISIAGASFGLALWYQSVVPTLLPTMILSSLIVQTGAATYITRIVHPLIRYIFHISANGSYCMLIGMLCGYPVGVKTCVDYIEMGRMDNTEGDYLLAFISFPSPMFLCGYIASGHLGNEYWSDVLLAVYLPIFLLNGLSWFIHIHRNPSFSLSAQSISIPSFSIQMLDHAIHSSVAVICKVGCYMMLFSILASFVQAIPWIPSTLRAIIAGILEMTTGIHQISLTPLSTRMQGSLMCGFASFGGFSTLMQTLDVMHESNLSLKLCVIWKILHGLLSALIFYILIS